MATTATTPSAGPVEPRDRRFDAPTAVRRWAVASLAGALVGLVVGGLGGRLFMAVLARLNVEDHGVITSDGFPMGEVTVSGTLNLLAVGTVLGVLGGGIFLLLRDLRFGPRWFAHACVVAGGTVCVGAVMVHADGPDFTLLEPTWAAIALSLAVPFVYLLLVPPLVDRWTRDDSRLMRSRSRWVWVGLVPWVFPLTFLVPVAAAGWLAARSLGRHAAFWWTGRLALTVLLGAALLVLVREVDEIYDVVRAGRYL